MKIHCTICICVIILEFKASLQDAVNNTENLWTLDPESGTVPISYVLDSRLDLETRENVERAVAEFNSNTCIRLTQESGIPSGDYLFFQMSTMCRSYVGKNERMSKQKIRVGGCSSAGNIMHGIMHSLGFYDQIMNLNRGEYVDLDFEAIKQYEIATFGRATGLMRRQFERCDLSKMGRRKGCRQIGDFDGDSILTNSPMLAAPVLENGQFVERNLTIFTLKQSAHALCQSGRCHPGQRIRLSRGDISAITTLYQTSCTTN